MLSGRCPPIGGERSVLRRLRDGDAQLNGFRELVLGGREYAPLSLLSIAYSSKIAKNASANRPASIPTILPEKKRMRTMIRPISASSLPRPPKSMVGKTNRRCTGCAMSATVSRFLPHRQPRVMVDLEAGIEHHVPAQILGLEAEPRLIADQLAPAVLGPKPRLVRRPPLQDGAV